MRKNIIPLFFLSGALIFLASCSSMRQNTAFSARKYYNFRHHDPVVVLNNSHSSHSQITPVIESKPVDLQNSMGSLQVSTTIKELPHKPLVAKNAINHISGSANNQTIESNTVRPVASQIAAYNPAPEKVLAPEKTEGSNSSINPVVLIILAILIPPLAVYLYDNAATSRFWIDLVLWILGIGFLGFIIFIGLLWLISVIYAVLIVTGSV